MDRRRPASRQATRRGQRAHAATSFERELSVRRLVACDGATTGNATVSPCRRPAASPPRPTVICFVRHGTTPTTGKVLPGRAKGLHLAEQGSPRQAARAAEARRCCRWRRVYASPLERTRETAQRDRRRGSGGPCVIERGLIECDFGEWTGQELAALAQAARVAGRAALAVRLSLPRRRVVPRDAGAPRGRGRAARAAPSRRGRRRGLATRTRIKVALARRARRAARPVPADVVSPCSVSVVAYGAGRAGGARGPTRPGAPRRSPARPPPAGASGRGGRSERRLRARRARQRVTVGTVGPVGERLFVLQARDGGILLTVKIEKAQVARARPAASAGCSATSLARATCPSRTARARALRRARLRRRRARRQPTTRRSTG